MKEVIQTILYNWLGGYTPEEESVEKEQEDGKIELVSSISDKEILLEMIKAVNALRK